MKIEKVKETFSVYIKIDGLKENFELDFLLDFLRFLKKDNILNKNQLSNGYENANKIVDFTIKDIDNKEVVIHTDLWINAPRILKWYIDGDNDRIVNKVLNNLTLCLQIFFEDKKETVEFIEK